MLPVLPGEFVVFPDVWCASSGKLCDNLEILVDFVTRLPPAGGSHNCYTKRGVRIRGGQVAEVLIKDDRIPLPKKYSPDSFYALSRL